MQADDKRDQLSQWGRRAILTCERGVVVAGGSGSGMVETGRRWWMRERKGRQGRLMPHLGLLQPRKQTSESPRGSFEQIELNHCHIRMSDVGDNPCALKCIQLN